MLRSLFCILTLLPRLRNRRRRPPQNIPGTVTLY